MLTSDMAPAPKKIIGLYVGNKLCLKGYRNSSTLKSRCDHDGDCSQNLPADFSIGDDQYAAKELMTEIQVDPQSAVNVKHLTTDADSHAAEGISIA